MTKKKILIIAAVIILITLVLGFFYFLSSKKKEKEKIVPGSRTLEEILREDLTAPSSAEVKVPKEVINSLTAPKKEKNPPVSDNIIKSLTAPGK